MKAGHVIALCILCGAAGAQLGGSPIPLGGKPVGLGGGTPAGSPMPQVNGSQLPSPHQAINYKNVAQGVNSRITATRTDVVQNAQAWQTLYSQMAGDTRELTTPAPVLCDFNRADLLVIHLGQKRTSGHSAFVSMIRREKPTEVMVDVTIQQPAPNAQVQQVVTSPYVVVAVDKQNWPYVFRSTFGYSNNSGQPARCGCTCGCPQCSNGGGWGNQGNYGRTNSSPFGQEICPPNRQTGNPRGGGRGNGNGN